MLLGLEPADFDLTMSNYAIFRAKVFEAGQLIMKLHGTPFTRGPPSTPGAVGSVPSLDSSCEISGASVAGSAAVNLSIHTV